MMTLPQIAAVIMDRRNKMNPIVMIGEMQQALGPDGFSEALNRRWLIPDITSGHLSISEHQGVIDELRALAEQAQYQVGDSVMVVSNGQTYAATVKAIRPDGSYELSYPDGAQPSESRENYKQDEIRPVARPDIDPSDPGRIRRHVPLPQAGEPQATQRSGNFGPRGPGIG